MSNVLKFPLNLGIMIHIYDLITIHLLRLASFQISNRPLPSQAIQEPKSPGKHRSRQPWSRFVIISCQSEQRFGHTVFWIPSGEPAGQSRQPQSEPSGRRRRGSWSRSWFRSPSSPPPLSLCCSCYSPSQPVGLIVGDLYTKISINDTRHIQGIN